MTNNEELKKLIAAVTAKGANVHLTHYDDEISSVQILGMKGVGPFPMPVVQAAERMREIVAEKPQLELALA